MPLAEPSRSAEAIKRALPALVKFDRYEHSARTRWDRAVRQLGIVKKLHIHLEQYTRKTKPFFPRHFNSLGVRHSRKRELMLNGAPGTVECAASQDLATGSSPLKHARLDG